LLPELDKAFNTVMRLMCVWLMAALLLPSVSRLQAQERAVPPGFHIDSDHDGISDELEQTLLMKFVPTFKVGRGDCSNIPAEFEAEMKTPTVKEENGTIYGQVFRSNTSTQEHPEVEIHYYHLWMRDCGGHGHPLDTEHVAVLIQASDSHPSAARWKALYWYAAAHEDTVCDVSQIARASTLHAEDGGAKVWISPGKHASYLNATLCQRGCGADRCQEMVPLTPLKLINLGEIDHPMNGSTFIESTAWPLAGKMRTSNFPKTAVDRLNRLPETDIAWFNPGRHPAQGIISVSSTTEQAIANGGSNTASAISVAGDSTGNALSTAQESTGNALQKTYRKTKHGLGTSARHVGEALHVTPKKAPDPK
jgi:hypothetical protein